MTTCTAELEHWQLQYEWNRSDLLLREIIPANVAIAINRNVLVEGDEREHHTLLCKAWLVLEKTRTDVFGAKNIISYPIVGVCTMTMLEYLYPIYLSPFCIVRVLQCDDIVYGESLEGVCSRSVPVDVYMMLQREVHLYLDTDLLSVLYCQARNRATATAEIDAAWTVEHMAMDVELAYGKRDVEQDQMNMNPHKHNELTTTEKASELLDAAWTGEHMTMDAGVPDPNIDVQDFLSTYTHTRKDMGDLGWFGGPFDNSQNPLFDVTDSPFYCNDPPMHADADKEWANAPPIVLATVNALGVLAEPEPSDWQPKTTPVTVCKSPQPLNAPPSSPSAALAGLQLEEVRMTSDEKLLMSSGIMTRDKLWAMVLKARAGTSRAAASACRTLGF